MPPTTSLAPLSSASPSVAPRSNPVADASVASPPDAAVASAASSSTDRPDAGPIAPTKKAKPALCSRQFPSDDALRRAPEGTSIAIADYFAQAPRAGRFTLEGFVQAPHHCPPCPPKAHCKPCEETVFLSDARAAYKHAIGDGTDFLVHVPDAEKFPLLARVRMTVDVCASGRAPPALPDRELRGYRIVSPP